MSAQTCNGWTNYETWLVNVWMSNSQGDQQYWDEQTGEVLEEEADHDGDTFPVVRLGERIGEWLDEIRADLVADSTASLMSDLLGGAISAVDTVEIARHLLDDYEEDK